MLDARISSKLPNRIKEQNKSEESKRREFKDKSIKLLIRKQNITNFICTSKNYSLKRQIK